MYYVYSVVDKAYLAEGQKVQACSGPLPGLVPGLPEPQSQSLQALVQAPDLAAAVVTQAVPITHTSHPQTHGRAMQEYIKSTMSLAMPYKSWIQALGLARGLCPESLQGSCIRGETRCDGSV